MTSPKRSRSSSEATLPDPKRARLEESDALQADILDEESHAFPSLTPTHHSMARTGLQRSIAIALNYVGFDTATPEAMESFTQTVETYMKSLIDETKLVAMASRRDHPIPTDFEHTLRHHSLKISSLKPHIRHPIPKKQVVPEFISPLIEDEDAYTTLPLLGEELSGQPDKDAKAYIPASFPTFPSKHTYSFTPEADSNQRDSKKTRQEAARTAQQGEDALRRLVRASKMRKQKEVKMLVERDAYGKERLRLWELMTKHFMGVDGRSEHADQVEIADHSMIVNSEAMFARKEVPRFGKRAGGLVNSSNA